MRPASWLCLFSVAAALSGCGKSQDYTGASPPPPADAPTGNASDVATPPAAPVNETANAVSTD